MFTKIFKFLGLWITKTIYQQLQFYRNLQRISHQIIFSTFKDGYNFICSNIKQHISEANTNLIKASILRLEGKTLVSCHYSFLITLTSLFKLVMFTATLL